MHAILLDKIVSWCPHKITYYLFFNKMQSYDLNYETHSSSSLDYKLQPASCDLRLGCRQEDYVIATGSLPAHIRKFVPGYILLTLYNSLVLPYLNYSILTWGGSMSQCNKLLTLQKRAVRIISNAGFHEHTAPLFFNLKILQIILIWVKLCINL